MQNVHVKNTSILSSQTGVDFKLRFDAIANVFQDVTIEHSKTIKLDRDSLLQSSNAFWVLSKMIFKIDGEFELFNPLTVTTWPCEPSTLRFNRCYKIESENSVINGVGEWCILDATTKTLRKLDTICYPNLKHEQALQGLDFSRIRESVEDCDFIYLYKTMPTDVDSNNHINNVSYVRMALNAFDPHDFISQNFKGFEIHFLNQTFLGDSISIYKKQIESNKVLITGKILDKKIFNAILTK